jgi:CPA2 family monovalent cation:H+ antiporter-2
MLIGPLSPLWSWILPEGRSSPDLLNSVGILSDISALNLFAEIGVILLLFVIGIEFPYAKIKTIGRVSIENNPIVPIPIDTRPMVLIFA